MTAHGTGLSSSDYYFSLGFSVCPFTRCPREAIKVSFGVFWVSIKLIKYYQRITNRNKPHPGQKELCLEYNLNALDDQSHEKLASNKTNTKWLPEPAGNEPKFPSAFPRGVLIFERTGPKNHHEVLCVNQSDLHTRKTLFHREEFEQVLTVRV